MLLSTIFSYLACLFVSLSLARPASKPNVAKGLAHRGTNTALLARHAEGLSERQNPVLTAASLYDLAAEVVDFIEGLFEDQETKEEAWVKNTRDTLVNTYPDKNVLIYHDLDSYVSLNNWVHAHYELPTWLGLGSKGYEIYVFDSGYFQLAGDGGYRNWAIGGSFDSDDNGVITFYDQS